jgi:predicted metal-binding protein
VHFGSCPSSKKASHKGYTRKNCGVIETKIIGYVKVIKVTHNDYIIFLKSRVLLQTKCRYLNFSVRLKKEDDKQIGIL